MTKPTPMDIIMRDGLTGLPALELLFQAVRADKPLGMTPNECKQCSHDSTWLDTIIAARRAKEKKPEGPDFEDAKVRAEDYMSDSMESPQKNLARAYLQVLKECDTLRELRRPLRTEDGEWPEEGETYLRWSNVQGQWVTDFHKKLYEFEFEDKPFFWIPAPPKPEDR